MALCMFARLAKSNRWTINSLFYFGCRLVAVRGADAAEHAVNEINQINYSQVGYMNAFLVMLIILRFQMGDADLDAIRQKRMAELQAQVCLCWRRVLIDQ